MISRVAARCGRVFEQLAVRPIAQYGSAMLRIGYGLTYLVFLLREFPNREELWGPRAAWTPILDYQFAASTDWYGWVKSWYTLLATTNDTRFELSYAFALLVCAAMALGWRTRITSCAFMLVVTTFTGRDAFLGDGGDNVLLLMSIYLVFLASGRRVSLDSRRLARRAAAGQEPSGLAASVNAATARMLGTAGAELAEVRRRVVTMTHNAAILVIGFQMCVIYGAAALWKAQGAVWENGTAIYYVLHTDWFRVWPGLSDEVAGNSTMIAIVAYVTVFAQVGFPFAIFSKRLKYVLLAVLLGMHLSIAVLLGIPVFSVVMIIGDSVFLPDAFWLAAGRIARRAPSQLRTLRSQAPRLATRAPAASRDGAAVGSAEAPEPAGVLRVAETPAVPT